MKKTSVRFRKRQNRRRRRLQLGFTLIETLVIITVIGVLAALSAPSFIGLMDSLRVDQTISEVRTALQSTQRQAIRGTKVCSVTLDLAPIAGSTNVSSVSNSSNTQSGLNVNVNTGIVNTNVNASASSTSVSAGLGAQGQGNGSSTLQKSETSSSSSSSTIATTQSDTLQNTLSGDCLTSGAPSLPKNVGMATNIRSSDGTPTAVDIKYGVLGGAEFTIQDADISTSSDSSGKIVAFVPQKQNAKKKCIAVSSTLGLTRVGTYVGQTDPSSITQTGVCTALEWSKQ